jgi:phosphatidylglycerophosphate synthase
MDKSTPRPAAASARSGLALCILGDSSIRLFGKTLPERIAVQFARAGLVHRLTPDEARNHDGPVIAIRADAVIDQPLVDGLLGKPDLLLLASDTAVPVAAHVSAAQLPAIQAAMLGNSTPDIPGIEARAPADLDVAFWKALRKRETPYALVVTPGTVNGIAWRMFMGTYKGATDLVTKHVWPRPAFHATAFLAARGVTPNMVTSVAAAATVAAFFLFLNGQYGWGLLAAWFMTFLDTVDGKLARTTLTSSKWGDVFDHGIDLVHPPFWYIAWALGLVAWGQGLTDKVFWWVTGVILGGYVLQRVMEGISIKWLGLEIHIWRPIDTFFRQITARRNPNLILLSLGWLVGRPDAGLLAVAAWTGICLVLHGLQLVQGLSAKKAAGGKLTSWMAQK